MGWQARAVSKAGLDATAILRAFAERMALRTPRRGQHPARAHGRANCVAAPNLLKFAQALPVGLVPHSARGEAPHATPFRDPDSLHQYHVRDRILPLAA